ncbi:MAG: hypothetical protein M1833_005598 [Piccolia ochrophora]|nr:MAG: hypothetical protein M1833_005598 [Piccolia ochrophora]
MPTYFSKSTKVELSVPNAAIRCLSGSRRSLSASTLVDNGPGPQQLILSEASLLYHDDDMHMGFLGQPQSIPFFLVRAGQELFSSGAVNSVSGRKSFRAASQDASSLSSGPSTLQENVRPQKNKSSSGEVPPMTVTRSNSGRLLKLKPSVSSALTGTPKSPPSLIGAGSDETADNNRPSGLSTPILPSPRWKQPQFATAEPLVEPSPLTLTVTLSRSSFCPHKNYRGHDVYIVVFFNGEFAASRTVTSRATGAASNPSDLIQSFTGRRIDRTQERKWVFVPLHQTADGSIRSFSRSNRAQEGSSERWAEIATALNEEALQWGKNERDQPSVVSEYLLSLAKLPMPPKVEGMQKSGGQKMGIIDVAIVLGKSMKDMGGRQYLRAPTRCLDPRYSPSGDTIKVSESKQAVASSAKEQGKPSVDETPQRAARRPIRLTLTAPRKLPTATTGKTVPLPSIPPPLPPIIVTPAPSKPRATYKRKSRASSSSQTSTTNTPTTTNTPATSMLPPPLHPSSSATPTPTTAYLRPPKRRRPSSSQPTTTTPTVSNSGSTSASTDPAPPRKLARNTSPLPSISRLSLSAPAPPSSPLPATPSRRRTRPSSTLPTSTLVQTWTPSQLSRDSFVGYAEGAEQSQLQQQQAANVGRSGTGGTGTLGGGAGAGAGGIPAVGECKAERDGAFEAEGVLMAVRFVIG